MTQPTQEADAEPVSLAVVVTEVRGLRDALDRRDWVIRVLVALVVVLLVGGFFLLNTARDARSAAHKAQEAFDTTITERTANRVRDCHALDEIAAGVKAGIGVVVTFQTPDTTEEQRARLQEFIDRYGKAVDDQFAAAKVRKGYSTDCSDVNATPQPGG